MSDLPADYGERLNLADLVARIERQQAETRKFTAEQAKLTTEAAKLRRERFLAPILAAAALGGFIAAAVPAALRGWGFQ